MGSSAQQICVVNDGILLGLAGPAAALVTFLAVTTQPLIAVCGTVATMTYFFIGVSCRVLVIHTVANADMWIFTK